MFKRLSITFSDISKIFSKRYLTISGKIKLLHTYCLITFKRFIDGRLLKVKKQKFLSFVVEFENFSDFYWTFKEIFIDDEYYFKSEKEDPFIIDCGGNIGLATLYFKYLYPKAKILVFEAFPENAKILGKNITLNNLNGVELVQKAVGDDVGELEMYGDNRAATICKDMASTHDKISSVKVPIVKLSEYIKDDVDFLKMDIEGAEGDVIMELSGNNVLHKIKQITMEYHTISGGNVLSDLLSYLEDNNFKVSFISNVNRVTDLNMRSFSHMMLVAVRN